MKSIVFLDLDGTLWDRQVVPESAVEAIKEAQKNGHLIFANTGRSRSTAWDALQDLNLDGFVFSAGSEIWVHGKQVYFEPLPEETAASLKETFDEMDIGYAAEGSARTFANEKDKQFLIEHIGADRISSTFTELPDVSEMQPQDFRDIMKYSIQIPEISRIEPLMEKYYLAFTPFDIFSKDLISGELTNESISKATGIHKTVELLNEPLRTIAIGDSENDLSMLEAADLGIAMGNGVEAAKEAADWTTADIHDDGLKKAFKYAGLID